MQGAAQTAVEHINKEGHVLIQHNSAGSSSQFTLNVFLSTARLRRGVSRSVLVVPRVPRTQSFVFARVLLLLVVRS